MTDFATRSARPSPTSTARQPSRWIAAIRRGLDVLVAFATLRDAELDGHPSDAAIAGLMEPAPGRRRLPGQSPAAAAPSHPHRKPLRGPARSRRPGTVDARPQACITPLPAKRLPRRLDRTADVHR